MSIASVYSLNRRPHAQLPDTAALESLPVAVLVCGLQTGLILYANARSRHLAEELKDVLPVAPAALVGAGLDVLGLAPAQLDGLGAGHAAAPLHLAATVGDQTLEFAIVALPPARGGEAQAQIVWSIETQAAAERNRHRRLLQMVEQMPINVMTCRLDGFVVDYANRTSLDTLARIEPYLPITASQLIGSSIDIFHKNPEFQRRMLADPSNLPHNARIKVGPETLDLKVSALTGPDGSYDGPMLTWALVTDAVNVATSVTSVVGKMAEASDAMEQASAELGDLTSQSQNMSSSVAAAAVEMSMSFGEVSKQIHAATTMTAQAAERATSANGLVGGLVESIERIGNVSALIERIASQTNLLALNAAIEAARVGEAGKGFAVVASEVKELALQTANATKDISTQVEAVQMASSRAARAVNDITEHVSGLHGVFTDLSAAVEEQSATNASVSHSIDRVSAVSGRILTTAGQVGQVSNNVSALGEQLREEMKVLLAR
ncbi:methyl-accepting chemotaxis protein [Starkeya koreensis]|uniref:Methyl-accepting chemotaxis protein n=1 Tax=Ancylobacter koreensis TaxID=266121 RepID=A0ABT0DKS4_9HYPH|nr:methyl-accepting chemotaxis protein [Ancylobacter koreensis]MCK0207884.1 methyl-accepting chemotaxis protein [Ancylobacter koreensis]